ncbi:MAG: hypothetical protein ABIM99_05400 [Candidatus Dojkabacteria bacterium]
MENSERRKSRNEDEAIDWFNFSSFSSLIRCLKIYGHLTKIQIATLFEIALKEEANYDQDLYLIFDNLDYLIEELKDALGDEELEDINETSLQIYIQKVMDM